MITNIKMINIVMLTITNIIMITKIIIMITNIKNNKT